MTPACRRLKRAGAPLPAAAPRGPPVRQLILMRHGKAEADSGGGDHARVLSSRGRAEAAEAGRRLAAVARPALALVSDSARTRQTFEALAPALDPAPILTVTRTLYGAAPDTILAELRAAPDEAAAVLVIGHNPGIGELARRLAGEGEAAALDALAEGFPTSCFAVIDLDGDRWADIGIPGRLRFLLPRDERSGA